MTAGGAGGPRHNLGVAQGHINITANTAGAQQAQAAMAATQVQAAALDRSMTQVNTQFEKNRQQSALSAEAITRQRLQVADLQRTYERYHTEYQRSASRAQDAQDRLTAAIQSGNASVQDLSRLTKEAGRAQDDAARALRRTEDAHERYSRRLASVTEEVHRFNEQHIRATGVLRTMRFEAERAGDALESISTQLSGILRIVGQGGIMGMFGLSSTSGIFSTGAAGLSGLTNVMSGLVETVQQLSGALALLPAVINGVVISVGTLAAAFQGIGTAFGSMDDPTKFTEALRDLAPAAQQAMLTFASFRDSIRGVRFAIQEATFEPFIAQLQPLIYNWLPLLQRTGQQVGNQFGQMFNQVFGFFNRPETQQAFTQFTDNMVRGMEAARGAVEPLLQAWSTLSVVGSSFFERIGDAITNLAGRFNNWITEAARSGQLQEWIDRALDGFTSLGNIAFNLAGALQNVFEIANRYGGHFLERMEELSQRFENWTVSPEGQAQLQSFFELLRQAGAATTPVLKLIGEGLSIVAGTLTRLGIATNVQPFFQSLVDALRSLAPHVLALAPILGEFLTELGDALVAIVQQTGPQLPVIFKGLADAFISLAQALPGIAENIGKILGYLSSDDIQNIFLAASAVWALTTAVGFLTTVMAANPFVLIGTGLAALVVGLSYAYNHSESFRNAVDSLASSIGRLAEDVGGALVSAFNGLGNWLSQNVDPIGNWLNNLWASVFDWFDSVDWASLGVKVVSGVIRGMNDMLGGLGDKAMEVVGAITSKFERSPAKEGPLRDVSSQQMGANIARGVASGMSGAVPEVSSASLSVANAATGFGSYSSAGSAGRVNRGFETGTSGFDQYINFLTRDLQAWSSILQGSFNLFKTTAENTVQALKITASLWGGGDNPMTQPGGIFGPPGLSPEQQQIQGVERIHVPGKAPLPELVPPGPTPGQQVPPGITPVGPGGTKSPAPGAPTPPPSNPPATTKGGPPTAAPLPGARPDIIKGGQNQPAAQGTAEILSQIFPQLETIGGQRPDSLPYHREGRALDIMIPGDPLSPEGIAYGNQIRDWLMANAEALGLEDTIWQDVRKAPGQDDQTLGRWDDITQGHRDHVHATFKPDAAPPDFSKLLLPDGRPFSELLNPKAGAGQAPQRGPGAGGVAGGRRDDPLADIPAADIAKAIAGGTYAGALAYRRVTTGQWDPTLFVRGMRKRAAAAKAARAAETGEVLDAEEARLAMEPETPAERASIAAAAEDPAVARVVREPSAFAGMAPEERLAFAGAIQDYMRPEGVGIRGGPPAGPAPSAVTDAHVGFYVRDADGNLRRAGPGEIASEGPYRPPPPPPDPNPGRPPAPPDAFPEGIYRIGPDGELIPTGPLAQRAPIADPVAGLDEAIARVKAEGHGFGPDQRPVDVNNPAAVRQAAVNSMLDTGQINQATRDALLKPPPAARPAAAPTTSVEDIKRAAVSAAKPPAAPTSTIGGAADATPAPAAPEPKAPTSVVGDAAAPAANAGGLPEAPEAAGVRGRVAKLGSVAGRVFGPALSLANAGLMSWGAVSEAVDIAERRMTAAGRSSVIRGDILGIPILEGNFEIDSGAVERPLRTTGDYEREGMTPPPGIPVGPATTTAPVSTVGDAGAPTATPTQAPASPAGRPPGATGWVAGKGWVDAAGNTVGPSATGPVAPQSQNLTPFGPTAPTAPTAPGAPAAPSAGPRSRYYDRNQNKWIDTSTGQPLSRDDGINLPVVPAPPNLRTAPVAPASTGTPGPGSGALTWSSSQQQVANAIIAEGRSRNWSDDQIKMALATAWQESKLGAASPYSGDDSRIPQGIPYGGVQVGPEGLGPMGEFGDIAVGYFQQKPRYYPNAMDPTGNIKAFFDNVDRAGGDIIDVQRGVYGTGELQGNIDAITPFFNAAGTAPPASTTGGGQPSTAGGGVYQFNYRTGQFEKIPAPGAPGGGPDTPSASSPYADQTDADWRMVPVGGDINQPIPDEVLRQHGVEPIPGVPQYYSARPGSVVSVMAPPGSKPGDVTPGGYLVSPGGTISVPKPGPQPGFPGTQLGAGLPFGAKTPAEAFTSGLSAVSSVAGDAFAVFDNVIKSIGATANIADLLVRGFENTEDIMYFVDQFQQYITTAASVAKLVSSATSMAAGFAGAGGASGMPGAGGPQAALQAVSAIAGVVQSALEATNMAIDLGQEVYHEVSKYAGFIVGGFLGGDATGPLGGNVRMLLNTRNNELYTYSQDNPLNKNTFNVPLWQRSYTPPPPAVNTPSQVNIYAGPGQSPRDMMNESMWLVSTGAAPVASVAGLD